MWKKLIAHYRHNPDGHWFKRAPYGWGWVPVKWQGWIVFIASVMSISLGIYVSQIADVPVVTVLGILVGALLTYGFGRWKGEKTCWVGFPTD